MDDSHRSPQPGSSNGQNQHHDPRFLLAQAAGAASAWTLTHVFHRPAATFPGNAALHIDPHVIGELAPRMKEGCVAVVGTNGKTTVTNMLADAFEHAGKTVVCNRTGANLASGVASALLRSKSADWGVLECDELWLAKVAPQLKPRYIVLLNLFRDQLDRMGEIEHIQQSIAAALVSSPHTVLIYNCDDPLCQAIAATVANEKIPFGTSDALGLAQNSVADAGICQACDERLDYEWRQYGQLGVYRCPRCGFARSEPAYAARDVALSSEGTTLAVCHGATQTRLDSPLAGSYMVYNLLAAYTAATCCGVPAQSIAAAARAFDPHNGRLQRYEIGGRHVLLNLAKNPTGFNQNLRIIENEPGPKAVAFFINDNTADGHDVSWLWDVDFQELAQLQADGALAAFAGGMRKHDMQVRLKYAGVEADLVESASDFFARAQHMPETTRFFVIANYTALPAVKAELDQMTSMPAPASCGGHDTSCTRNEARDTQAASGAQGEHLTIVHLYPELLNLYGDGGNITVLEQRARWRGIDVTVMRIEDGQKLDLSNADIVFLGGGPDREQRIASAALLAQADELRAFVEDDGVLLAICGGYQILGRTWLMGEQTVPGLGVLDIETKRVEGGSHNRLVGNVVLDSPLASMPVVGYENHAGRTFPGAQCQPFGQVIGHHGHGNNDAGGTDGTLHHNIVASYLHGPLLAKNPEVADWLIERALARRAAKEGRAAQKLYMLDDAAERAANEFMRKRR